jgi:hypothetical protein
MILKPHNLENHCTGQCSPLSARVGRLLVLFAFLLLTALPGRAQSTTADMTARSATIPVRSSHKQL